MLLPFWVVRCTLTISWWYQLLGDAKITGKGYTIDMISCRGPVLLHLFWYRLMLDQAGRGQGFNFLEYI